MLDKLKKKIVDSIESLEISEKTALSVFLIIFVLSLGYVLSSLSSYVSEDVPAPGGSFTEGVVGYPRYINPIFSVTDSGKDIATIVYSGLLKASNDGSLIPDLAKDYSVSEDGLTYTVNLKDDIYFHDDEPVTSRDVEFTIKKVLDPAIKSPKAVNWEGIVVEVLSDKQISFTLKKAYSPFLENLTLGILPKHIWKDVDSEVFPLSEFNFEPIGSGPYKIKEAKRDKSGLPEYYHLVPFKKYALGKPYIKNIFIKFYGNEEKLVDAYLSGEIDSMSSISSENAKKLEESGVKILRSPLPRIFGVFFNQNESKILSQKEVRLALATAVGRKEIIEKALDGYGSEVSSPIPSLISTKIESETESTEEERISNAKKILEKAGFELGEDNVYQKKTKAGAETLAFSISTSDIPELKGVGDEVKRVWEKMGAKVEIKIFDLADLQQNVIRPRRYDALLFGEVVGRETDLFAFWHSSERNDPGLNIALYTNPTVDKILTDARTTNDIEKRNALYQKFEDEIANDIPAVFLYSPDFIYIPPKGMQGVELSRIIAPFERFLSINKWYKETERVWNIFN